MNASESELKSNFWLDSHLAKVARKPLSGLPLPLRRFTSWYGHSNPLTAIETATDQLLDNYSRSYNVTGDGTEEMIRISRLCELCNVTVKGHKILRHGKGFYCIDAPKLKARDKTGRLDFGKERSIIHLPRLPCLQLARVAAAHELGHLLIHQRDNQLDRLTIGLPSSPEEEAVAEYAARLLLTPERMVGHVQNYTLSQSCVYWAGFHSVTIHAATLRFGDQEIRSKLGFPIRAAILWKLNPARPATEDVFIRMTPQWFVAPDTFIPVGRCRARQSSIVAQLASHEQGEKAIARQQIEEVNIGSLKGRFLVDAFAWGSLIKGSRLVLALFCELPVN